MMQSGGLSACKDNHLNVSAVSGLTLAVVV